MCRGNSFHEFSPYLWHNKGLPKCNASHIRLCDKVIYLNICSNVNEFVRRICGIGKRRPHKYMWLNKSTPHTDTLAWHKQHSHFNGISAAFSLRASLCIISINIKEQPNWIHNQLGRMARIRSALLSAPYTIKIYFFTIFHVRWNVFRLFYYAWTT